MTLKQLSDWMYEYNRGKRPGVPLHALPRTTYSDKTANGLTKAIVDFVNATGGFAERNGNEGRYREGETVTDVIGRTRTMRGMFIPGHKKGAADVQIRYNGKLYDVEIKIGSDRQRPDQVKYMNKVRATGGVYEIVKNWEQFYNLYSQWVQT